MFKGIGVPQQGYTLTISANTNNADIRSLLVAAGGNPASAVAVLLKINAGIRVGDSGGLGYALRTGSPWNSSATITIENRGAVRGKGGGGNSGNGGDAISLAHPVSIDNSGGLIGGGGGGGGVGSPEGSVSPAINGAGGGGGGGGAGDPAGGAGAGQTNYAIAGSDGAAGGLDAGGAGGDGGVNGAYGAYGGSGGAGGALGTGGGQGDVNGSGVYGAAGGTAGYAVRRNGNAVTWLASGTVLGSDA
jgi:hypothetical protein